MARSKVGLFLELGFITALLFLAALPLVFWRGEPILSTGLFVSGFLSLAAVLGSAWWLLQRRLGTAMPSPSPSAGPSESPERFGWLSALLVCVLLAALT